MSKYNVICEYDGQFHQTTEIDVEDLEKLATVMAYIEHHVIDSVQWEWKLKRGSITYQNRKYPHQVIKILIDYEQSLLLKVKKESPQNLNGLSDVVDPVVVGVELTHEDPYKRHLIREGLKRDYRYYVDPRVSGNEKYYLQPYPPGAENKHIYDILFLEEGTCNDVPEELVHKRQQELERKYGQPIEDDDFLP